MSAEDIGPRMYTYGSYELGTYIGPSDVDIIFVTTEHITHEHFSIQLLKKLKACPEITECRVSILHFTTKFKPIVFLYTLFFLFPQVPVRPYRPSIIKFKFSGRRVDLRYVRVPLEKLPLNLVRI